MMMKTLHTFGYGLCLLGVAALPALAQNMPPTTQQLQQQHNQAIQNESSTVHSNLNQSITQTPAPTPPTITPRGRIVSHPPGYIPVPNPNR
jgi:hypothetical protein